MSEVLGLPKLIELSQRCWQEVAKKYPRSQRTDKFMECMRKVLREYYLP